MGSTRVSPQEITRRFLKVFHSNCVVVKNLNNDYEKNFGTQAGFDGQKIGPTLNIRKPIQTNVRHGWTMNQQSVTESYIPLTIDTVRGVDLNFSEADEVLSIDDFGPRYVDSPAKKLAAIVDQYAADYIAKRTFNCVAASGFAVPTSVDTYLAASEKLKDALVPFEDGLNVIINPRSERKIVNGLAGQYNPQSNISELFLKGQMSKAAGLDWFMSQILPTITMGTTLNSDTPVVGTFVAANSTSLPYTSATSTGTWTEGSVFTIADLYDLNFETKGVLPSLKQFVVRALSTAVGGAEMLTISPAINFDTTSPDQNCYVSGNSIDGKAIVLGALDGNTSVPTGTASAVYQQNLILHRDAFAFASVPLLKPKNAEMAASVSVDAFTFRLVKQYDIINSRMLTRMDIFFGMAPLYPQWAAKMLTV